MYRGNDKGKGNSSPTPLLRTSWRGGVGGDRGGSSASTLLSFSRSRRFRGSHSAPSHPAPSSAGTSFSTYVVGRKSSSYRPAASLSARRSRTFQRHFHFPVSFRTSAHRIQVAPSTPGNLEDMLPSLNLVPAPPALWSVQSSPTSKKSVGPRAMD